VKGQAVQAPRLDELIEASKRLSLEAESTPGKARPGIWWEKSGYLILPRHEKKNELLRSLSSEVRKIRAAKSAQDKERK
jgi:signal recognition particle subunit SEC65